MLYYAFQVNLTKKKKRRNVLQNAQFIDLCVMAFPPQYNNQFHCHLLFSSGTKKKGTGMRPQEILYKYNFVRGTEVNSSGTTNQNTSPVLKPEPLRIS